MTDQTKQYFFDNPEQYKRNWDIKNGYLNQAAHYVSSQSNVSFEEARELVRDLVKPGGEKGFRDPKVAYLQRGANGDRKLTESTWDQMMYEIEEAENILSPSMVAYTASKKKRSLLSLYTASLVTRRATIKKLQHEAKQQKNHVMEGFHKQGQTSVKIAVNSISGATCSPHNAFYNPSMHTTLTSTCCITTAYANTNNERFITGNRHYWNPEICINNIASIITYMDRDKIKAAIELYGLVIPSGDEVYECCKRSTELYWQNNIWDARILNYCRSLDSIERAAVVYTGDLYHIGKHNPEFTRQLINDFKRKPTDLSAGDDDSIMKHMDSDMFSMVGIINQDILRGKELKDIKAEGGDGYRQIVASVHNTFQCLEKYELLIHAFMKTKNVPCSIANMPSMRRRAVLGGDTDSSMATAESWVYWYSGNYVFDYDASCVAAVIIYFVSMTLIHILAQFSANVGVDKSQQYQIAMKNEFMYSSYIRTTVSKHYYSEVIACEGNVYEKPELDTKGVQLHAGKAPEYVKKEIKSLQERTLKNIANGTGIDLLKELKHFGNLERTIMNSIKSGSPDFLTFMEIKDKGSYNKPFQQPYLYHQLWEDVFAPKYGHGSGLPYQCIKVSCNLPSKTAIKSALDVLNDQVLADRFRAFNDKYGKTSYTYVVVPLDVSSSKGIPEEILAISDIRGLIKNVLSAAYLIFESFGVFFNNANNTKLISDFY